MSKKMTPEIALEWIEDMWDDGKSVIVNTGMSAVKWTPKTARSFKKMGIKPFKIDRKDKSGLWMASGRKYEFVIFSSTQIYAE